MPAAPRLRSRLEFDDGAEFPRTFSCFSIRLSPHDTAIRRFDIVAQAIPSFPVVGAGDLQLFFDFVERFPCLTICPTPSMSLL